MINMKFFARGIMTQPCVHRFKSLANAKAYAKQVTKVCKEKRLDYLLQIFSNTKVYFDEVVTFQGGIDSDEIQASL